jgi:UDP-GlcNAc:undecaprenyl-phosphate/decaprenyl-phosphate GlcNAc-1-phosphate transferase
VGQHLGFLSSLPPNLGSGPKTGDVSAITGFSRPGQFLQNEHEGVMSAGLLAFLIALAASLVLTVPVRALAIRVGMVDLPGPRKVHLKPIPLLGGLAIYGGVMLAILLSFDGPARAQSIGIVTGATLVAVVGFLDDRGLLHHQIKLFLGMPLAAVALLASGVHANVFSVLVGGATGYWLDAALTILWVVGITASFSILDHMDGLCAGVAAMASVFFAILAYLNGQTVVAMLAAATLGAASGFLRWNFKPAKIFMGDGGAMFLGFLMATLGLKLRLDNGTNLAGWLAPLLVLGATIFDTTLVSISRLRRGLLPFATPGKDHAAHRLANIGFGQRGAVLAMYLAGALCGGAAILVTYLSTWIAALVALAIVILMAVAIVWLERAPYERQKNERGTVTA